jgi:hypothetical protein
LTTHLAFLFLDDILIFQDYAIETPFETLLSSEGQRLYEVQIKFAKDTPVAAVNFVLKVVALNYQIASISII